jgi:hypothetical protein
VKTLERLYDEADYRNITVIDSHLTEKKKAASIASGGLEIIVLDCERIRSRCEEKVLFAEELGHHLTGELQFVTAAINSPNARYNRIVMEGRVRRWVIHELLPREELYAALAEFAPADSTTAYELAERFGVTSDFIVAALEQYEREK